LINQSGIGNAGEIDGETISLWRADSDGGTVMIGFRVDANEEIATGHLMRCIAIASACEKRGEKVLFFLAENKETGRLDALGFPYEILGTDWRDMEGEAERLLPLLRAYSVDWLVVDSYQAEKGYLSFLNAHVKVLYVDDFGGDCYDVSAVLHYNPWADEKIFSEIYRERQTELLVGGKYIPLREEFSKINGAAVREHQVLITTGGTDAYNVAGRVLLECLGREKWENVAFDVIVGSMNSHQAKLQALAERYSCVHLHNNVTNMSDYMRRCKVAVSAGGTTLYELCACGLPTVCFSFADNQKPGTEAMGKQGVMVYAGDARTDDGICEKIGEEVLDLLNHQRKWDAYSQKMQRLVDGRGAERIALFLSDTYKKQFLYSRLSPDDVE